MDSPFKKGRLYEDDIAKGYGKREPASGSMWTAKQDNRGTEEYKRLLFQAKNCTDAKSHSIKREDLKKLKRDASRTGRVGVYAVRFGENEEYFMLPREDFDYYFKEPIEGDIEGNDGK